MDQTDRRYLRQQLPNFQVETPFVMNGCTAELQGFFRLYGFDRLLTKVQAKYSVGQLSLGGYKCVAHFWAPQRANAIEQRQTVVITHGLFDHSGLYLKLVEQLLKNNMQVFMADFPGHGLSEGEPAHISDFSEYASVVADSVLMLSQQQAQFGKISLVGQSTGAAAILRFLFDQVYVQTIYKVVLLAPLVRPKKMVLIKFALPFIAFFRSSVNRRFTHNSNDTGFCEFLKQQDELQTHKIPLQWIHAMLKWVRWFEGQAEAVREGRQHKLDIPLLIIQGKADDTVDWVYNIPLICGFFEKPSLVKIAEARHHLVNESKGLKQRIFAPLIKFLL